MGVSIGIWEGKGWDGDRDGDGDMDMDVLDFLSNHIFAGGGWLGRVISVGSG